MSTSGSGHGHVVPRADGERAGCGGPGWCSVCADEKAALDGQPGAAGPEAAAAPPPFPEDVAALKLELGDARAELAKLKADKLALETAMARERELLADVGNDSDADLETRIQAWVAAYTLDVAMDPKLRPMHERLPLTAVGLHLLPEGTVTPPTDGDVAAAHTALVALREGLRVALDLARLEPDSELLKAFAQRCAWEANLRHERAQVKRLLDLPDLVVGELPSVLRERLAGSPASGDIAALQASSGEARKAEAHWKARADERAADVLARERELRQARERAETAEAACRRLEEELAERAKEIKLAAGIHERLTADVARLTAELARANDQVDDKVEEADSDAARFSEEQEKWKKERADLLAKIAQHEAVMATAHPLAPVLDAADAREGELRERAERAEQTLIEARGTLELLKEQAKMANEQRDAARRDVGVAEGDRDRWLRRAVDAEALAAERAERLRMMETRAHAAEALCFEQRGEPAVSAPAAESEVRPGEGTTAAERRAHDLLWSASCHLRRLMQFCDDRAVYLQELEARLEDARRNEGLLEASRRDADFLRRELATIKLQVELKAEVDESHAQRYERARGQAEELRSRVTDLEAEAADSSRAREGLRGRIRELERAAARHAETRHQLLEAQRHADELVGRVAGLERELESLQADRRHTAADALRARLRRAEALSADRLRRWEDALAEVDRLREELAQRPPHPIDPDALRGLRERAEPLLDSLKTRTGHTCAKPAMHVAPEPPCSFCRHGGPGVSDGGCARPEAPRRQGWSCLDFEPKVWPPAATGEDKP